MNVSINFKAFEPGTRTGTGTRTGNASTSSATHEGFSSALKMKMNMPDGQQMVLSPSKINRARPQTSPVKNLNSSSGNHHRGSSAITATPTTRGKTLKMTISIPGGGDISMQSPLVHKSKRQHVLRGKKVAEQPMVLFVFCISFRVYFCSVLMLRHLTGT